MIERLDQLTVAEFIDLLCGDTSVITGKHFVKPDKVADAVRNIIFEYKTISDKAGAGTYLSNIEDVTKAKMELSLYSICSALITLKEYDRVREILDIAGINSHAMSDKRLDIEVKTKTARAKLTLEKLNADQAKNTSEDFDIRREFDSQTAALMSHFKFQIDIQSMKASLYAHLIARYKMEIKAQMAALKKK